MTSLAIAATVDVLGIISSNLVFAKDSKKDMILRLKVHPLSKKRNHKDSKYFSNIDYFKLKLNKKRLTMLSNYQTYQQTKEYSCELVTALMVFDHYGKLGK
ncbi:MAG: hypothetical protein ACI35O_06805 [Bacillaceae bacterium]